MADEHPAVAYLRNALDLAEKLARAASRDYPDHCPGDPVEFVLSMCDLSTKATAAAEAHIRLHKPEAVLRQVAKARELLAEHGPDDPQFPDCLRCSGEGFEIELRGGAVERARELIPYPCRTVLLLAEMWGWEA